jgi:hypothetical protein
LLGETLTITHNSVARVLPRINQDNFQGLYQLRTTTEEFRVVVKHSTESSKPGVMPLERHYIEYTHSVFATLTVPEFKQVSSVTIRCARGDDPDAAVKTAKALNTWLTDANVAKLIAWES